MKFRRENVGFATLLALSFFLSGYMIDLHPQIVAKGEAGSVVAAEVNNRGVDFYRDGKFHEALGAFIAASEMDETVWQPHFNCAVALAAMGKLEKALLHLELSMEIDPDNRLSLDFYQDLLNKVNTQEPAFSPAGVQKTPQPGEGSSDRII